MHSSEPTVRTSATLAHIDRGSIWLHLARSEARSLDPDSVGTEHILLSLLLLDDGVAAPIARIPIALAGALEAVIGPAWTYGVPPTLTA